MRIDMATLTDITPFEILKPGADAAGGILAELINSHHNAYSAFNVHSAEVAELMKPTAAHRAENRELCAKERAAARELITYRPGSLAEVRAKAAYAVLAGEALTSDDREAVLRSLL
jgi:hypothetical protein